MQLKIVLYIAIVFTIHTYLHSMTLNLTPLCAVAEQVVSKRTWTVLNKTVRVAQYKRQVDPLEQLLQEYKPESTIVLKAVPVDIHPEHLTFYIEKVTTLDKDNNEFKLRHSPDGTTCLLAILDQGI